MKPTSPAANHPIMPPLRGGGASGMRVPRVASPGGDLPWAKLTPSLRESHPNFTSPRHRFPRNFHRGATRGVLNLSQPTAPAA